MLPFSTIPLSIMHLSSMIELMSRFSEQPLRLEHIEVFA